MNAFKTLFGFSSIFISTPHIRFNTFNPFTVVFLRPKHTRLLQQRSAAAQHTTQGSTHTQQHICPPPHARSRKPKALQSSPHPPSSASPSKPAQPPLTLLPNNAPPPPPFSSMSFWANACNSAYNRPLQTLLVSAYASCGVTVRCAAAACCALWVCIARGW